MTSKISFFKMAREEMRKLSWLTAVQLLVFGLLIPFRVLLAMASLSSDVRYNISYTHQDMLDAFCRNVGFNRFENTVFILAAGILCAYCGFSYLYSSAKLDFYHSIPMRREKLLAVKVAACFGTFAFAYLFSQATAVAIGAVFDAVNGTVIFEILVSTLRGLLYFLCSYSGALVAMMLTGKMVTAVLATGTLGVYLPMIYLLTTAFQEVFMSTALISDLSMSELLRYTSPWALCLFYKGSRIGLTGAWPTPGDLLLAAVVTAVLFAAAVLLYRMRKTEAAGRALAFPKLEGVVKILLTVPPALVAAAVAYELYGTMLWEIVFLVIFGVLSCLIMEFIYRWDIRQTLMHKRDILLTLVLAGAIFFGIQYDLTGFNSYLPEKNEITAMSVKCYWKDILRYRLQGEPEEVVAYDVSKPLLDYLETEDFEPIYRLAQDGVKEVSEGYYGYGDKTLIGLKYHLKNGKEIYRRYWVKDELYEDVMNELLKNPDYKERFYPIMTWTEEEISRLFCECGYSEELLPNLTRQEPDGSIVVPADRILELVEAYREDLRTLSYTEVWDYKNTISFYSERTGYMTYPLNGRMEHTKKILESIME